MPASALRLAAVTGARAAEVVALRWDDLDGRPPAASVASATRVDGEVAHPRLARRPADDRVVVLDPGTVDAIDAWHREADEIVGAPTEWMLAEPGASIPPSPRWLYEVFMRAGEAGRHPDRP